VSKLKFFLAPVDAFVEPAVVVPNIGGNDNSHLWLTGRHNWRDLFVSWLHKPHQDLTKEDAPVEDDSDDCSEASADAKAEEEEHTAAISDDEDADEVDSDDEVEEQQVQNCMQFGFICT